MPNCQLSLNLLKLVHTINSNSKVIAHVSWQTLLRAPNHAKEIVESCDPTMWQMIKVHKKQWSRPHGQDSCNYDGDQNLNDNNDENYYQPRKGRNGAAINKSRKECLLVCLVFTYLLVVIVINLMINTQTENTTQHKQRTFSYVLELL